MWYQIVFVDADLSTGQPTAPIQNVADDRPVYASVAELALILQVNATTRHDALMRVLKAAADEIDAEVGTEDIHATTLPYSNPPAIAREINLERAVEHWQPGAVAVRDRRARRRRCRRTRLATPGIATPTSSRS